MAEPLLLHITTEVPLTVTLLLAFAVKEQRYQPLPASVIAELITPAPDDVTVPSVKLKFAYTFVAKPPPAQVTCTTSGAVAPEPFFKNTESAYVLPDTVDTLRFSV